MAKKRVAKKKTATKKQQTNGKRRYLSQSDVPAMPIDEAMRVAKVIADEYACDPTAPLQVASALEMQPKSSHFRTLCGAALAYGLTDGGPNAEEIGLTDLGKKAVRPTEEGQNISAMREAALKPRVVGEFLRKYNKNKFPRKEIGLNVLLESGVPQERTSAVFDLIEQSAKSLGFLTDIKGVSYVDLAAVVDVVSGGTDEILDSEAGVNEDLGSESLSPDTNSVGSSFAIHDTSISRQDVHRIRRVFITHGKNQVFIEPLKDLLGFGDFEPVVSVDRQSVSKPVPDKVMDDMRSCAAAIIHVENEQTLIDSDGEKYPILNPNVLIEIGAAMALYGRRFILLVKDGIKLPSNLQGLYEVRYEGEKLDADATIKVLKALKDIKNHQLPKPVPGGQQE